MRGCVLGLDILADEGQLLAEEAVEEASAQGEHQQQHEGDEDVGGDGRQDEAGDHQDQTQRHHAGQTQHDILDGVGDGQQRVGCRDAPQFLLDLRLRLLHARAREHSQEDDCAEQGEVEQQADDVRAPALRDGTLSTLHLDRPLHLKFLLGVGHQFKLYNSFKYS